MSNLIPADKLISEIERLAKSYQDPTFITVRGNTANNFRDILLSFITSLQQDQPSLPSNLDEAAKEYMRNYIPFEQCDSRDIIRTFKAGAEWMAGRERPALTWQDITTLIRLCEQVKTEWWFRDMKGIGTQKYFEEVLRRFNEQRRK